MPIKINNFFLLIMLVAFVGQTIIWQRITFTDEYLWVDRVNQLATDWRNHEHHFDQKKYSEHPGMPAVMLAAVMTLGGKPARGSLAIAVSLIVSVVIASLVTLMHHAEAQSWWWAGAATIVIAHPLYFHSSPVDAVIAPLIVLVMALFYLLLEKKENGQMILLALMVTSGLALSTRLHFAIVFLVPAVTVLLRQKGWKFALELIVGSLAVAWVTNPLLWYTPMVFLRAAFIDQLGFFTGISLQSNVGMSVTPEQFMIYAPLALISLLLLLNLFLFKRQVLAVGNSFVVIMLLCTAVPFLVLVKSRLQSLRYFFPLFFLWEAFLPLWLWRLAEAIKNRQSNDSWLIKYLGQWLIILLVISQLIMVFYIYYLPEAVVV